MNWSRTKTWLIVLFAAINIFLIITIITENAALSSISDSTIESTVNILAKNKITVKKETVPKKMPSLCSVSVVNSLADYDSGAERFLGAGYEKNGNVYKKGSKTFTVNGDEFDFSDSHPDSATADFSAEYALDEALDILPTFGFDIKNADAYISYSDENIADITVSQNLDSYPLLDSRIVVTISRKGLSEIKGCWFYLSEDQSESGQATRVKDSTAMLLDFMPKISEKLDIVDISIGYMTGDKSTFHKTATATPAWQITCANGLVFYEDAN